eukprot:12979053-Alexandrium_andersonii.AAC.1
MMWCLHDFCCAIEDAPRFLKDRWGQNVGFGLQTNPPFRSALQNESFRAFGGGRQMVNNTGSPARALRNQWGTCLGLHSHGHALLR